MGIKDFFKKFFNKHVFNHKWQCLNCGREVFDKSNFCQDCYQILPFNDGYICGHCGRKVIAPENYCTTCKGKLVYLDKCRSCFSYEKPINNLIYKLKFGNGRYLVDYFADRMFLTYSQNYFNADVITFVPMTDKSLKKRGYNQSELLAKALSDKTLVPIIECVKKVKETKRQTKLSRAERIKNLTDAFRVSDKKLVKEKTVLIVDDVTTTGSTAEVIAERLKKAGAKQVYLITVASTPPIDKY